MDITILKNDIIRDMSKNSKNTEVSEQGRTGPAGYPSVVILMRRVCADGVCLDFLWDLGLKVTHI